VQFVIESFNAAQVGDEAPGQHQRHGDHLELRSEGRVVEVVLEDAKKAQQDVYRGDKENCNAKREDAMVGATTAPGKAEKYEARREKIARQSHRQRVAHVGQVTVRRPEHDGGAQHYQRPEHRFDARQAPFAEAHHGHREGSTVDEQRDDICAPPGIGTGKRPGARRHLIQRHPPPGQRHQAEPSVGHFLPAHHPERKEEAT
jgi:hypothetical protein